MIMEIAQHQFQAPMNVPTPVSSVEKPTNMLQQQSVIQSNQQLQQQLQSMHDGEEAKRREILTRRPSYRYKPIFFFSFNHNFFIIPVVVLTSIWGYHFRCSLWL